MGNRSVSNTSGATPEQAKQMENRKVKPTQFLNQSDVPFRR